MRFVCFVIAAAMSVPVPAGAQSLTLFGAGSGDGGTSHGHGGDPSLHAWDVSLFDEAGVTIGTTAGFCNPVGRQGHEFCNFVIIQPDTGQIVVTGVRDAETRTGEMVIVGGSGEFAGVQGTLVATPVHDEGQQKTDPPVRWRYDIELTSAE